MATHLFGIYGFNFCREIAVGAIRLVPLYQNLEGARRKAKDKKIFHLTGYGEFDADPSPIAGHKHFEQVDLLQDAMTFCDQCWVLTSKYINVPVGGVTIEESVERLPQSLDL